MTTAGAASALQPGPEPGETCAKCGAALASAVYCFACEAIQPEAARAGIFEIFGLRPAYRIDFAQVEELYGRLSMALHPDFFATAEPAVKSAAERLSAALNEGYRVLQSDVERSAYLLKRLAGTVQLDTKRLPDGFLQEMFLLQEEIDELDEAQDGSRRRELSAQLEARRRDVLAERERLFEEALTDAGADRLQAIQNSMNQESYLIRLLDRLPA